MNPYQILNISVNSDQKTIIKAYRKLARKYHPDVSNEPNAEARFKEINAAYHALKKAKEVKIEQRSPHSMNEEVMEAMKKYQRQQAQSQYYQNTYQPQYQNGYFDWAAYQNKAHVQQNIDSIFGVSFGF